jgi:predicted N-acetyltransferase YhbS
MILIRLASAGDLPLLGRIECEADSRFSSVGHDELVVQEGIPPHVAQAAIDEGRVTVAEVDGAVVGWLFATRVGGELCLGQVSVLPEHGQQGIGTALLRDLITRAREMGDATIVLNTQSDVPWNLPWYSRHGFVVVPEAEWTPGMRDVTAYQTDDGLDWATRVHMRLSVE